MYIVIGIGTGAGAGGGGAMAPNCVILHTISILTYLLKVKQPVISTREPHYLLLKSQPCGFTPA